MEFDDFELPGLLGSCIRRLQACRISQFKSIEMRQQDLIWQNLSDFMGFSLSRRRLTASSTSSVSKSSRRWSSNHPPSRNISNILLASVSSSSIIIRTTSYVASSEKHVFHELELNVSLYGGEHNKDKAAIQSSSVFILIWCMVGIKEWFYSGFVDPNAKLSTGPRLKPLSHSEEEGVGKIEDQKCQ